MCEYIKFKDCSDSYTACWCCPRCGGYVWPGCIHQCVDYHDVSSEGRDAKGPEENQSVLELLGFE